MPPVSGRVSSPAAKSTGFAVPPDRPLGVLRTFQTTRLFPGMSVLENVMVGRHARGRVGLPLAGMLRLPAARREERDDPRAGHWRSLDALRHGRHAPAPTRRSLPFGRQRIVELARALAGEPRLLLLDEPACGLNIRETERLGELIRGIRGGG